MGILAVVAAAVAAMVFGAIWYSVFAKPWMAVSGVPLDETGQPANRKDPMIYVMNAIGMVLVAGMMRHVFVLSGIDTVAEGAGSGFGIGLFLVVPWLLTNSNFAGRPIKLAVIDGGFATFGCTLIGTVLTLL
ncbi:MAG: DUF1761 domain-containing protein [Pseudomonadota bacterium]